MSDRTKLTEAFATLATKGYATREDFMCCMGCGVAAIAHEEQWEEKGTPEEQKKWVFFHGQDADAAFGEDRDEDDIGPDGLYLAWGGDGKEIVGALEETGFEVEWDGSDETRILVLGGTD